MIEWISNPWPWYVAGPLLGLIVPMLLLFSGKAFGISSSFQHICAAALTSRSDYFRYDWRRVGGWNLAFVIGIASGGVVTALWLPMPPAVDISLATVRDLAAVGITDFSGLVPDDLFSWSALATLPGIAAIIIGGFLVGFGARYADGCTSGHAISGLGNLQAASLFAVIGFFAGGLFITHVVLPVLL